MALSVFISWPSAPLTSSLVSKALQQLSSPLQFITKDEIKSSTPLLQWSTYDDIDHELMHFNRETVLSSSYTFRKALIRKHFLSRIIQSYITKNPTSVLQNASPRTFEIEISFADELDEMWTDELWELGDELDTGKSWWILKPGMADRGMGIRIFHSKDGLQNILESFEAESDSEDNDQDKEDQTGSSSVVTSRLRHFVIQHYIDTPLLFDPTETNKDVLDPGELVGRKFHLRVYCVASGGLQLYVYDRVLALFSSVPYEHLSGGSMDSEESDIDLRPHLTNTSLQGEFAETNVKLLDELENCTILSGDARAKLTSADINAFKGEIARVLPEVFKAALQNPVHFQAVPNAFELFGVDFLVSHDPAENDSKFTIKLLEINAEPAIELTGPRLTWILEDLFKSIANVCVQPFFSEKKTEEEKWNVGETKHNFIKCLNEIVRGAGS